MVRRLSVTAERFALAGTFTISRGVRTHAEVVTVVIEDDGLIGRGEGTPNARYDENQEQSVEAIEAIRSDIEAGLTREALQELMPASAARNAVDCAMWDLDARRTGKSVWKLADRQRPEAITTAYTLSLGSPAAMAEAARAKSAWPLIKLKLGGDGDDMDRLRAVRDALPEVSLIVDANEALDRDSLQDLLLAAPALGIEMIEQPLPAGDDGALADIAHSVPLCADESCHTSASLSRLKGLYDMINIKLDKTGGLTEALALDDAARRAGFGVMVGCMVSTSLGLAPAQIIAAGASYVDLDSALYLAKDRDQSISYDTADMKPAPAALWGG